MANLHIEDPAPIWGSRSVDSFEKLEQIGEGAQAQVYRARDIRTGEVVALKKIRMCDDDEGFPTTAIREIKLLTKLRHENVIHLKEVVTSSDRGRNNFNEVYLVFEYMEHDLDGLFQRPGVTFTIPQIKCYMKQLLAGLHYCHERQVLHRDVKVSNLLVDNKGILKLADFGLSRYYSPEYTEKLTNEVITRSFRPPELLLGATKYGPEVDMWSFGCVLAKLLNRKQIFSGKFENVILKQIFELCGSPDENNWPGVSNLPWYDVLKPFEPSERCLTETYKHSIDGDALRLLENILVLDPLQRISARDALDDDYFKNEPLPCDPKSLPPYESSHMFQILKNWESLKEAAAKKQ